MLGHNLPQVTKNLVLLNILMFVLKLFFDAQGVNLNQYLGIHYFNSPLFEPYQIISHMFMHADPMHLIFNMFGLVIFGSILERVWGARRFFIFYFICGLGATLLDGTIGAYQVYLAKEEVEMALRHLGKAYEGQTALMQVSQNMVSVDDFVKSSLHADGLFSFYKPFDEFTRALLHYQNLAYSASRGASGAILGIMAAFGLLFPNTELTMVFPPITLKAKYIIGFMILVDIIGLVYVIPGDNVGHWAHLGGAITGAIIVFIWRRNRQHFY